MHSEKGHVEEKATLDAIRTDFVSDGLSWANLSEDRKMVHLWRKLKRTEDALRAAHQETQLIKQQRKEEMVGIEEFISNIRSLSQQKDTFTHQLESENENMRRQLRDCTAERDALLSESSTIANLLALEGLQQNGPASSQLKSFLTERNEWEVKIKSLNQEKATLTEELERVRTTLDPEKCGLQKDVSRLTDELDKRTIDLESVTKKSASLLQEIKLLKQQFESERRNWEDEKLKLSNSIEGNTATSIYNVQYESLLAFNIAGLKSASQLIQEDYSKQTKQLESENSATKRTLVNCRSVLKKTETERSELRQLVRQ